MELLPRSSVVAFTGPGSQPVQANVPIGSDDVYFGSDDGYIYAVSGAGTLADTPWPKFRHDNRNTGSVGGE